MQFKSFFSFTRNLLPSTPFNNFVEIDDYNLEEALRSIVPDPTPKISRRSSTEWMESRSYLSHIFFQLYRQHCTIPLQFLTQPSSTIRNCTFEHPRWSFSEWYNIWESKPIMLNPSIIPPPTIEETFHGALLRVHLTHRHLSTTTALFAHGTTIAFEGDDRSQARYVVEWCERIEDNIVYLKVVGMDRLQNPYPYNDPNFPAFILAIPLPFFTSQPTTRLFYSLPCS